jgi:hypothetical protein
MPGDEKSMPIYTATKSLDVRYTFKYCIAEDTTAVVPGANTHAILYAGCQDLLAQRKEKTSIDSINFATAAVTLLYTDTSTEEGYLGEEVEQATFPLAISGHRDRILSSINFYTAEHNYKEEKIAANKAGRNNYFNDFLTQRIKAFSTIADQYDLPQGTIASTKDLTARIASPMFHETYHHSEQGMMHALSTPAVLQSLAQTAVTLKAGYLYGMVLDIYTQRTLCCNCNACLLGLQNSHEQGFLADFSAHLEQNRVQPRVNGHLMLSTRVSASKAASRGANLDPLRLPNDAKTVHEYDADIDNEVLQAENKALGTQAIINKENYSLDSYRGTFFVSKQFANARLQSNIKLSKDADQEFIQKTEAKALTK